jgi:NADH-quinone oxidoreductase subunit M
VQRVFFGPITNEENAKIPDIAWNELAAVGALFVFIVWIGVHPGTFLRRMTPSVQQLLASVQRPSSGAQMAAQPALRSPQTARLNGASR